MRYRTLVAAMTVTGALSGAQAFAHEGDLEPLDTDVANPAVVKLLAPKVVETAGGPEVNGAFSAPFVEPTVGGQTTDEKCVEAGTPNGGKLCKPAAGTLAALPDGRIFYFDALEGTENNKYSIVAEGGTTFTNDAARLLDLRGGRPSWSVPEPFDGGANPNGNPGEPLIPGGQTTETYNDGALFGSHQSYLPDGRLLIQGGTDYSADPGVDGIPFGIVELTGLQATRIFDPAKNRFVQTGDTASRRWYPTLIETGDGRYLDFSGVGKLLKPIYPERPGDSFTNVKQVERYDPATGKWTMLGRSADRDLPLYPRVHLLPDGKVFYNAAGQDFNPFGQSYGEAGWMNLATFDPKAERWAEHGIANTATPTAPGFRGSTSSTMLALEPDAGGAYTKARFLTAGGVLLPSPGSYLPTDQSSITTVDTAGGKTAIAQAATGPLNQARWFGQNVLLPDGKVVVFSGADKDEVVGPGSEMAIQQSELFDPKTGKWTPIAVQHNPRTYHNSAVLLPSGEVLVGGHATISTLYLNNTTLPGGFAPHDGRDPSFEIFKPPYLFRGPRPEIARAPSLLGFGRTVDVRVKGDAADIESVALVRNSAITHIVDADQRTVMLRIVGRRGNVLTIETPPSGNVAPPGPYMLFLNGRSAKGPVPSVAAQLLVTADAAADRAAIRTAQRSCASRRALTVHVRRAYRRTVRSTTVRIGKRRVGTIRGARRGARVSLRGMPKGTVRVQLVMRLRDGRRVIDTRTFRTCTKRAR
jgi:hypothetical protein